MLRCLCMNLCLVIQQLWPVTMHKGTEGSPIWPAWGEVSHLNTIPLGRNVKGAVTSIASYLSSIHILEIPVLSLYSDHTDYKLHITDKQIHTHGTETNTTAHAHACIYTMLHIYTHRTFTQTHYPHTSWWAILLVLYSLFSNTLGPRLQF